MISRLFVFFFVAINYLFIKVEKISKGGVLEKRRVLGAFLFPSMFSRWLYKRCKACHGNMQRTFFFFFFGNPFTILVLVKI